MIRSLVVAALLMGGAAAVCGQVVATGSGVRVTEHGATLEVRALRDDVLRVREWQGSAAPEDASWAVLPEARTSSVAVTATPDGFTTRALRVHVDSLLQLTVTDLEGRPVQKDAAPVAWDGTRFTVSKVNSSSDHYFGLGDKPGPADRAGEVFTMWNTDAFGWQESSDPIYKSVPFFLDVNHGRAVGVFLDNTWRSTFDFGRTDPSRMTMTAPNGALDYYILYGPEPKAVVTAWAWLTGPTPLPPLWALGFQQSRYSYFPETQLRDIANHLRKDRIPTDVLWMDIDYQHDNWPFTVNKDAFPDFPGMVADLAKQDFKLVVITDLHIARQPGVGYMPYDSGMAGDQFVKSADGQVFTGKVWPGASVFPDYTRAQTRTWWGGLYKEFVADGVAGFWNDMNEPSVFDGPGGTMPLDVQHRIDEPGFEKRTATHAEIHNVYGMQQTRGTMEGALTLRPNERPFVMTRASYAGGQRYATTWTGDNSSTWNHLRQTIPQLENLGLSGFAMAGADVGGFAGSPSPALLTKWIELSAFQPIDRDHSAKGTNMHEVWVDGPEQEDIRRRFIEERYRLMPYLYTTAEEMSRTGLPIDRPLFLDFPFALPDGTPAEAHNGTSEFLFGSRILVAPNPSPEEVAAYDILLPAGTWYDYWTGERLTKRYPKDAAEAKTMDAALYRPIEKTPKLEELPVYVRGGSILPVAPLVQSTAETPDGPLTLRVYPGGAGEACAGEVYTDDGHSFDYRKGMFARVKFTCEAASDGSVTVRMGRQEGSWTPWWKQYRVEVVGWTPKSKQASAGGHNVDVTQVEGRWGAVVPATAAGGEVTLR